jgi:hypothetical protein
MSEKIYVEGQWRSEQDREFAYANQKNIIRMGGRQRDSEEKG